MKLAAALMLVLNLNAATAWELQSLPGVGPVLARRIVEFREKRGGFRRVEELLAIPGISEKKWRTIKGLVEIVPRKQIVGPKPLYGGVPD